MISDTVLKEAYFVRDPRQRERLQNSHPDKTADANWCSQRSFGMKAKVSAWGNRIYHILDQELSRLDYVILGVLYVFLFLSFTFPDVIVTGNRSFIMQSYPLAFYRKAQEIAGNGANYLPSTFWLYAAWNLPLRLLHCVPDFADAYSFSLVRTVWYRLLPLLFFAVSARSVRKIALRLGMDQVKAKLCQYLFLAFPCTIFSQFIFSQYDIFTVCMMLLGYEAWLKEDNRGFVFWFGLAITFKYQALVYFVLLLVYRHKQIFRIIWNVILVAIPAALEILIYYHDEAFISQVFGFNAISYTGGSFQLGGLTSVTPFLVCVIALMIFAYVKPYEANQAARYSVFLMNGVNFAFYGLAVFNPQWLLIAVPFQVFGIMMNKKAKFLLLLEDLFIVAFYILTVNYYLSVDQWTLGFMVWHDAIMSTGHGWPVTMSDIYLFTDTTFLFTIVFSILGSFFWLSHPRYQQEDCSVVEPDTRLNVRLGLWISVLAWAVPAYLCLMAMLR